MLKNYFLLIIILLSTVVVGQKNERVKVPGVVVEHSRADSKIFLGSPSIVILPTGEYIASLDYFGSGKSSLNGNYTMIKTSIDEGKTWKTLTSMSNIYWGNLFYHNNALYLFGTSGGFGNIVIRKSIDKGKTWTNAVDDKTGLLRNDCEYHTAPVPITIYNGRIYRAFEVRSPAYAWAQNFEPIIISAPVDADLLNADNWKVSNRIHFNQNWIGEGWLEGNVVVNKENQLVNVLRVHYQEHGGKAAIITYDENKNKISFDSETGFINFPGGCKKFTIRYDEKSKRYWTLSNHIKDVGYKPERTRNCLALSSSPDLLNWTVHEEILYHPDVAKHGFQYADWQFDGESMIVLVRTAYDDVYGGAASQHDANYITFHRILNFRSKMDSNIFSYNNEYKN